MAEVARKIMGDAPLAYVEGTGGVRVAEDEIVSVGKNDVRSPGFWSNAHTNSFRYFPSKLADSDDP